MKHLKRLKIFPIFVAVQCDTLKLAETKKYLAIKMLQKFMKQKELYRDIWSKIKLHLIAK